MGLDKFARDALQTVKFLKKDFAFMDEVKELAITHKCINLLRYIYHRFLSSAYPLLYYQ